MRNRSGLERLRNQRGTELIEFAFVLPLLLVLTLTVVDFSRAFLMKSTLSAAAREGARVAVVTSDPALAQSLGEARAESVASASGVGSPNATIAAPDGNKMVTCTITGSFSFLYPGLFQWLGNSFSNPMTLTATASFRKEG